MTKEHIDNYFTSQIPMIRKIIDGIKYKNNKTNLTTDMVISECYLHIHNNMDKLKSENQLQRMMVQFCKQNILWTQSKVNRTESVKIHTKDDINYQELSNTIIENALESKIEIEEWYQERKEILEEYKAQETNKYNKIFFDIIFEQGYIKNKDIMKYTGLNKDAVSIYKKRLFAAIDDFIHNNKKDKQ